MMKTIVGTAFLVFAALGMASTQASANSALAEKHGCTGCHDMNNQVVGPSFKAIAAKYKGKADAEKHLATAIKHGSSGVWGSMPMPEQDISDADAKQLAKWILGL
jgi:cytochrome c